jgi:hypothetical protein
MPTAGRSRGELMAGTLLFFIRWLGRRAPRRIFFFANWPAALAAGRATGSAPKAGRSRGKLMAPAKLVLASLARVSRTRAAPPIFLFYESAWRRTLERSATSAVRLGGAERRAGFLFVEFTGGAGRWPSYGGLMAAAVAR